MADLKSIEILCIPCPKCNSLEGKIKIILKSILGSLNTRTSCKFIIYTNRKEAVERAAKLGYVINQLPVVFINEEVAFTGSAMSEQRIRMILEGILKY